MHNCYSNCSYMHGYCSMCNYYFNNFFSLLLTGFRSLSISSFDQIIPLLSPIIKPLLLINHQTTPIADHQTTPIIHCHRSSNHSNPQPCQSSHQTKASPIIKPHQSNHQIIRASVAAVV